MLELSCDEGAGEACGNDYYPKFEIDHNGLYDGKDDFCCAHGSDFRTNWVRSADVDTSNPVDIHLELWDQDDLSGDDVIHWAKTGDYLDLKFDLNTCTFTGGGLTAQQGAGVPNLAGESETGGEDSARGYFTITTPTCIERANEADSDGDGIMNAWETPGQGLDVNDDGTIDLRLGDEPYGALPYRKDLFVDADHMTGDAPQGGAIQDVKDVFAKAPVDPRPDPSDASKTLYRGVSLHIDEAQADAVPKVAAITFQTDGSGTQDDFNDLKNGNPVVRAPGACSGFFGTAADRSDPNCVNILEAKRQVYRYMIFGETYAESPNSSGIAEWNSNGPKGGNDFMVTLGTWGAGALTNAGGRRDAEASTFLHEYGHTLSLGHGGDDVTNCKPNYLSVMNYTLQFANKDAARPLDFTSAARGTALGTTASTDLDEASLDENSGVFGLPANPARNTVYGVGGKLVVAPATSGPIDWNGTNGDKEPNVGADINYIQSIGSGPADVFACSATSPGQTLDGFDDWANIQYDPRLDTGFFADGARPNLPLELTEDIVLAMSQKADLTIAKAADQPEAAGGDTVSYTTTVTDLGPGTATNVEVTDTLPDGSTRQRSLPDLSSGAVHAISPKFTYAVPCDTTDGTVLTNHVKVTGTDTDGVPDPYTDDNVATAKTTVRAPVLTASSAATAAVNAGEAITYALTYANAGGGGASAVTITATLPAGVYYSAALDSGSGPKPTSATLNGDGTRTLRWIVGSVPAHSGDRTIVFTARPTLLARAGTTYASDVSVSYKNAGGACDFEPVTDSTATTIAVVAPTRDPLSQGFWKNHQALWTAEILARIQATDQRYDSDGSGDLSASETTATFTKNGPKTVIHAQLMATYFNLATRRIVADTAIGSKTATALGLSDVADAATYAQATIALPIDSSTSSRYSAIIGVLDDINQNKIELY